MTSLAITVIGHDRPGIIAQTAAALAAYRMNLEDSSMTLLRGHFAMTLVCSGDASVAEVEAALVDLAADDLLVNVRELADEPDPERPATAHLLTVHGADRLGIVARLTDVVAAAGGNITDFTTRLAGDLYVLAAELDLPAGADPDGVQRSLAAAAADLGVDVHLSPIERDEL